MTDKKEGKKDWAEDKSTWAIGGMTMIGVGVGLIFVQTAPILLVSSIIVGVGLGIVITSIISSRKKT